MKPYIVWRNIGIDFKQGMVQKSTTNCTVGNLALVIHWVFQYRVLEKIPSSGSGSGPVGVLNSMIRYFWASFLLLGISGYRAYLEVVIQILRPFLKYPVISGNIR